MTKITKSFITAMALSALSVLAAAEEGALGRTIPGVWVMPQAGVVGPNPGFSFTVLPIGFAGSISGNREIPLAGSLVANVSADLSSNYLIPEYVYKTEVPNWNFASSFMGPANWVGVSAAGQIGELTASQSSAASGLGDVIFSPMIAGVHFSQTNNLAIGMMIFAPTGAFNRRSLSNLGLGTWTITPNVAHTYVWPKAGLELDNFLGFDIYARNQTTRYSSGTMFHWDGMLLKYVHKNRLGFGGILSNLTQITEDRGTLADILHGFEGRAWAAGPEVLYVAKVEKPGMVIQLRWVPEFGVTNLIKGNMLLLGLSLKLD